MTKKFKKPTKPTTPTALDLLQEFVEDIKMAYGTGRGDSLDKRAREDWPDLIVTYEKACGYLLLAPTKTKILETKIEDYIFDALFEELGTVAARTISATVKELLRKGS